VSPDTRKVQVEVDGRTLTLSKLDKVLYPAAGFTKAQVIDYYLHVAPVLLPHIASRTVTIKRYPEGVDANFFYQKNAPAHRPDWVPTARIASPGSTKSRETIEYLLGGDLPTLICVTMTAVNTAQRGRGSCRSCATASEKRAATVTLHESFNCTR